MEDEDKKERRKDPPCDVHGYRLKELETGQYGMKTTMYGKDGTGGVNKAVMLNTESVATLRKFLYAVNIPILISIILMMIKLFFGGK